MYNKINEEKFAELLEFSKQIHTEEEVLQHIRENKFYYDSNYSPNTSIELLQNILKINKGFSEGTVMYMIKLSETDIYPNGRVDIYYAALHEVSDEFIKFYAKNICANPSTFKYIIKRKTFKEDTIEILLKTNPNNDIMPANFKYKKWKLILKYQDVSEEFLSKHWKDIPEDLRRYLPEHRPRKLSVDFVKKHREDLHMDIFASVEYMNKYSENDYEKIMRLAVTKIVRK